MDQNRFFAEVTSEQFELDDTNSELQVAAEELREQELAAAYAEYIQAMLHQLYETDYTYDI